MAFSTWIYFRHFPPRGGELHGGMNKAVHGLAAGLVANGVRVTVLCEGDADETHDVADGYTIRAFRNAPTLFPAMHLAPGLTEFLLNAPPPDTIVLNGIFSPSVARVGRVLRRRGLPYIIAPHDPYHPSIFSQGIIKKWVYWHLAERPLLAGASRVQVLDKRHAAFLRDYNLPAPAIEVQNGYLASEVPPESSLGWNTTGPINLLFLGRLDAHNKGIDLLLDALRQLPAPVRLTLQGPDWGDKRFLENKIRHDNLTDRVTMIGPDFHEISTRIMARHDVLCLPSRFEGFGLSALEAMTAGRVLLVSDVAGVARHVRASGCGLTVKAGTQAILGALRQLIARRDEWQTMGLAGRAYAIEHLNWTAIARGALSDYAVAAAEKHNASQHPLPRSLAVKS